MKTRDKILKKMNKSQEDILDMGIEEIKNYFQISEKIAQNILAYCREEDENN